MSTVRLVLSQIRQMDQILLELLHVFYDENHGILGRNHDFRDFSVHRPNDESLFLTR